MDVGKLVGKTFYSFTGRDGRLVEGYKFFCTFNAPLNDPMFVGEQCASFSISKARHDLWLRASAFVPEVGDGCVIRYDKYGRLEQFDELPG